MEQQTLSVAKAGLVCKLNARTTVFAVTNTKARRRPDRFREVGVAGRAPWLTDAQSLIDDVAARRCRQARALGAVSHTFRSIYVVARFFLFPAACPDIFSRQQPPNPNPSPKRTSPQTAKHRDLQGSYDAAEDMTVNTAIGSPLLSRFDLVLLLLDTKNKVSLAVFLA